MNILLLVIVLLLVTGYGGFRHSGYVGGGVSIGTILLILLLLWFLGLLPR